MLYPDPEMCFLWNTSKITCNMRQRQKDLIQPLTLPTFVSATAAERSGHSSVCVYGPRGQEIGFRNPFVKQPLDPFPQSGRLEWATEWMFRLGTFLSKSRRNLPQSGTSLFLARWPVPGRASASQERSPGSWCPLPTSGRRKSRMG